jgi:hypothetical protein
MRIDQTAIDHEMIAKVDRHHVGLPLVMVGMSW